MHRIHFGATGLLPDVAGAVCFMVLREMMPPPTRGRTRPCLLRRAAAGAMAACGSAGCLMLLRWLLPPPTCGRLCVVLCCAIPRHAVPCYAMLCRAVPHHAALCYAVPCRAVRAVLCRTGPCSLPTMGEVSCLLVLLVHSHTSQPCCLCCAMPCRASRAVPCRAMLAANNGGGKLPPLAARTPAHLPAVL